MASLRKPIPKTTTNLKLSDFLKIYIYTWMTQVPLTADMSFLLVWSALLRDTASDTGCPTRTEASPVSSTNPVGSVQFGRLHWLPFLHNKEANQDVTQ